MKNAIILHGGPSREEYYDPLATSMSNAHWVPWLQGQLLKHDVAAATPEVPRSFERDWPVWQREVERFDIGPDTILVGHSTGAGFFIKYLSIHPKLKVGHVVLVAPWLDPLHELSTPFFTDFEIDPGLAHRSKGLAVFESDNDQADIKQTVKILRDKLKGAKFTTFHNYGHFCYGDMHTTEFPELLAETLAQGN
jgi:predicted alpha/beta hydrolase family esterase